MHEADQPDVVGDFSDADVLSGEHDAEIGLAAAEASASAAGHCLASANWSPRQVVEA